MPDYLCYTPLEAQEVLQITDRRPARAGVLETAERRAQGLAGQPETSGRGRGRGHKLPKPSRLGLSTGATTSSQQQGLPTVLSASDLAAPSGSMRPSQSAGSFLGGTSFLSGLEEGEGEEEVVGGTANGLYEDIEEEVVDDRNIDEEFEKVLEQAEDVPSGTPGDQPAAAGGVGAGVQQPRSAAVPEAQQQQQRIPPPQPMHYHVTFEDEQPQPQQQQHSQQQQVDTAVLPFNGDATPAREAAVIVEEDDWEDVDEQPAGADGKAANGLGDEFTPAAASGVGVKRSWGPSDTGQASAGALSSGYSGGHNGGGHSGGGYSGAAWPSVSGGGQATSSGMPSSSQGGAKKIRLSLKRPSQQEQQQ